MGRPGYTKAGILVNLQDHEYRVVRQDNGQLITTISMLQEDEHIKKDIKKIERYYAITIVNKQNVLTHLRYGMEPVLAWRPGKRSIFSSLLDSWWESGNITKTLRNRRKDT